ncbi:hypothetical protein [Mesorhizobium sp. L48C026A00]|uniref:hypothetical protein n=1 Tax=Mesorhizobium sp. L48C026A00 TaxID=1287182 RepID=UPI0003D051DD|nr:hypothetical protein [Mesorhizobium sp. L48C026A00]ESZ04817.1 hypothetical protein X737_36550 [Mesorhizobium sp. L48C026A00]
MKRLLIAMIMIGMTTMITIAADEPTIVSCQFEKMPPMILTFRGGMGANDTPCRSARRSLFP